MGRRSALHHLFRRMLNLNDGYKCHDSDGRPIGASFYNVFLDTKRFTKYDHYWDDKDLFLNLENLDKFADDRKIFSKFKSESSSAYLYAAEFLDFEDF